jgi:Na+/proline symporter
VELTSLFPLFSGTTGWLLVGLYAAVVFALTSWFVKGYSDNKTSFLVARREIGGLAGAMSIAASWAWAPALFISAQMAYLNGIAGLFWFTIGNFLTLIIFGSFVHKIRASQPEGFTLTGYIRQKFSNRVQNIFLIELWMLAACAFAINVLAGSQAVQTITGINYHFVTLTLGAIALLYALRGGLKASVITEIFKIVVLWVGLLVVIPWAWSAAGGASILSLGLGGITGNGASLTNEFALGVFMAVGMSTALGHLGAPWGDNGFYQRAFAIKQESIRKAFYGAAFIFVFVPLMIGSLGFVAAGAGLEIPKELVGMTTVITIGSFLPSWTVLIVLFMLLAGLVAVLDSQLNSAASLVGHDVKNKFTNDNSEASNIAWSRWGMIALATMALGIANWPGMTLLTIFLFFGVMRATVWWPMMLHLWKPDLISEKGMFWGIVIAFAIGFPTFVYGQMFGGGSVYTMVGTLIAIFGSGALAYYISNVDKSKTLELISKSE